MKVSIVIRTANRNDIIDRALKDIENQTCQDFEVLIVNDGGDDGKLEQIVKSSKISEKIKILKTPSEKSGRWIAANIGLKAASGEYFNLHDDDDTWDSTFLQRCVDYLDENSDTSIKAVCTWIVMIEEVFRKGSWIEKKRIPHISGMTGILLADMIAWNCTLPIGMLTNRESLLEVGLFDQDLPVAGDWEHNIRFLRKFDIGVIPEYLANYHVRREVVEGALSNSIVANQKEHGLVGALVRNRLYREDPNGIGILAQNSGLMAKIIRNQLRYRSPMRNLIDKIKGRK